MEDVPGADARLEAWLALALAAPLSPAVCRRLRTRFPDPGHLARTLLDALGADGPDGRRRARTALLAPHGPLAPDHVAALDHARTRRRVEATRGELASDPLARVVTIDEPVYPAALAASVDPPPVLFLRGSLETLAGPAVAVIGSRDATHGGRERARAIARELAASGIVVVSGLALGMDAAAHAGALEGGGRTLAYLATGIDEVYPRRHRALAETMLERGGALAGEFPFGHPPKPWGFPQRNRLISGTSLGVVVVEAGLPSGSLTTARHALEQGREVMAVPGAVDNPASAGCHALIRDGAALVTSATDVLRVLAGPLARALADTSMDGSTRAEPPIVASGSTPPSSDGPGGGTSGERAPPAIGKGADDADGIDGVDDVERRVLDALESGSATLARVIARSALDAPTAIAALARLELAGRVVVDAGGRYARRRDERSAVR